jgi:hypothetical protein
VSEKAKLIRGDPPKIDFKKEGEPPKKQKIRSYKKIIINRGSSLLFNKVNKSFFLC